ncbi:DNA-binding response regulator [Streptomyces sp. ISL-66]|uniref:DNA-binding response regulator n=1 Tax=Streptomyces sp. ISL-66 TaxID=2819186 RepID=UPI0020362FE7|nr:DNA-binding response regulator [Streptomyces sp. ISL-66]
MPVAQRVTRSLRVLLAPPNPALAVLLRLQPDIEVVPDAFARPAVALTDSVELVPVLLAEDPECRVLVLAGSARGDLAGAVLAAGAAGLVLRDGPVEDLADSIRRASRGEIVIDPALAGP